MFTAKSSFGIFLFYFFFKKAFWRNFAKRLILERAWGREAGILPWEMYLMMSLLCEG